MLTRFDIGEIRFQMDYHTNYHSKVFEKPNDEIDVLLIRYDSEYSVIDYIVTLSTHGKVEFVCLIAINGSKKEHDINNLTNKIFKAIQIINYYNVGKGINK